MANRQHLVLVQTGVDEWNAKRSPGAPAPVFAADLRGADLRNYNLQGSDLYSTDLSEANLRGADLRRANMTGAMLVDSDLREANLSGASLHGAPQESAITVDNLEVAQFIYLMTHNRKLRKFIDTITSKVILILGHFLPERKAVLDALRPKSPF